MFQGGPLTLQHLLCSCTSTTKYNAIYHVAASSCSSSLRYALARLNQTLDKDWSTAKALRYVSTAEPGSSLITCDYRILNRGHAYCQVSEG